jgi:hypothetical protein
VLCSGCGGERALDTKFCPWCGSDTPVLETAAAAAAGAPAAAAEQPTVASPSLGGGPRFSGLARGEAAEAGASRFAPAGSGAAAAPTSGWPAAAGWPSHVEEPLVPQTLRRPIPLVGSGLVAIGFAVMVLLGLVLPFLQGDDTRLTADPLESWLWYIVAGAAIIAAVDAFRGANVGLGAVAGLGGSLFVWTQLIILHFVIELNDRANEAGASLEMGYGAGAGIWGLAGMIVMVLIVVGVLAAVSDQERSAHPLWAGPILVASAILLVGLILPEEEGLSVGDHLFSLDGWFDMAMVGTLLVTGLAGLLGALARTPTALAMAMGAATVWAGQWFLRALEVEGGSGVTTLNSLRGTEGLVAIGSLGVIAFTGGALLHGALVRRPDERRARVIPALAVVAVLGAPVVGIIGAVQ